LVSDGVTGRLIRPGAIEEFAGALAHYCRDPEARTAAGRAGIAMSSRFGWDEVNQALVDGYCRIIRQRAAGGRPPGPSPVP
jgi:glycosyltransferase involved in cell wall biosynthesis